MKSKGKFDAGKFPVEPNDQRRISPWIPAGYILSFLAGLPGILIGSIIITGCKSQGNGQKQYMFNARERKNGKIILYLGCSMLIISILFFMNWFILEKLLFGRPPGSGPGGR